MSKDHAKKARLLGKSFGSSSGQLRKMLLFEFARRLGLLDCYRCGWYIALIEDLSIEHKEDWLGSADPVKTFFDLDNIAFSHIKCNSGAVNRAKTHCPQGHEYTEEMREKDGSRNCRECRRKRQKRWYHSEEYRQKRKEYPSRKTQASF